MVGRKITFRVRCRAERCFFLARGGIFPSRHGSATPKVFLPPIARKIVMSIAVWWREVFFPQGGCCKTAAAKPPNEDATRAAQRPSRNALRATPSAQRPPNRDTPLKPPHHPNRRTIRKAAPSEPPHHPNRTGQKKSRRVLQTGGTRETSA
jgi:hypothetical protein